MISWFLNGCCLCLVLGGINRCTADHRLVYQSLNTTLNCSGMGNIVDTTFSLTRRNRPSVAVTGRPRVPIACPPITTWLFLGPDLAVPPPRSTNFFTKKPFITDPSIWVSIWIFPQWPFRFTPCEGALPKICELHKADMLHLTYQSGYYQIMQKKMDYPIAQCQCASARMEYAIGNCQIPPTLDKPVTTRCCSVVFKNKFPIDISTGTKRRNVCVIFVFRYPRGWIVCQIRNLSHV